MPRLLRSTLLLLLLAPLAACSATTDRERYAVGDSGSTAFHNDTAEPVFLEGCSAYSFEQLEGERWTDRGPAVVCVWEGFAQRIEPRGSAVFDLRAPAEAGTWRLRYRVGLGCTDDQPLRDDTCASIASLETPPFAVVELCDPSACGPRLGMPNLLCPDGIHVAGPTDRCLRDLATGQCGWEIASCPSE
jgi:hypothetical protein